MQIRSVDSNSPTARSTYTYPGIGSSSHPHDFEDSFTFAERETESLFRGEKSVRRALRMPNSVTRYERISARDHNRPHSQMILPAPKVKCRTDAREPGSNLFQLRPFRYAILSRMTDKARADIAGKIGDYHTDCPLDHMLLDWKGVEYAGVRKALEAGATDEEIVAYLNTHGTPKTQEEIIAWSESVDKVTMHGDPEKGEWFDSECRKLGLDPAKTTMFEWLEADDRASYTQ